MKNGAKVLFYFFLSFFTLSHCGYAKEQKNETETSNLLATIMATEFYYFRYNCPPYKLLDTGTTTVHLNQGEEFWFDFKARFLAERPTNKNNFEIRFQEAVGQEVKLSFQTCLVNNIFTKPQSTFPMSPDVLPDSGLTGQLEIFNIFFFRYKPEGDTVITIKATMGSGNVLLTIPSGPK
ncbi:hypothetical protein [Leptospira stimsonii]|uniref:Lipoprotein n=1 Tax=Leptospira stimsonii TaxID=2202203 RepID=A0ABY2N1D1_9LEPT|nr:hypothetical protein [Leptospira stimsonii]TGK20473.1 hypothetical protein EHO98_08445 [Leptospira stimsonii]TGM14263.1 hypothetical protein EHQ90_11640 [Leptospira stimsonii]